MPPCLGPLLLIIARNITYFDPNIEIKFIEGGEIGDAPAVDICVKQ